MQKRFRLAGSLILSLVLILTACGDAIPTSVSVTTTSVASKAATTAVATNTAVATSAATAAAASTTTQTQTTELTFTDKSGYKLTLAKKAERVVCLNFDCVDWLAEFGMMPIGVGKEIAAYTPLPYLFGEKAKQIPTVGGSVFEPNLEEITKAKPDLIIGYANFHENIREPLKAVAPVMVTESTSLNEAYESLKGFALLVGKSAQAESAIKRFQDRYQSYKAKSPKDKTVMFTYGDGASFVVRTDKSLVCRIFNEMAKCPWMSTAKDSQGGTPYSLEEVLKADPDAIYVYTLPDKPKISEQLKDNNIWKELKAVKNRQVLDLEAVLVECSGMRSLNELLDQIMTRLYPQVFPKPLP
jgi:iron complex transport system substrate-binding protein